MKISAAIAISAVIVGNLSAQSAWFEPGPSGKTLIPFIGHFVDAHVGYAVADTQPISKTINGGGSWFPLEYGPRIHLASVHFPRTHLKGYAIGQDGVTFLKTNDGGTTWTRWTSTHKVTGLHFVNDSTAFGISENRLVRTFNGGITWQEGFPPVDFSGYGSQRLFFGNEHFGFLSMHGGYPDYPGRLFKTTNGGAAWTEIPGVPYLAEYSFVNPDTGYATGHLGADSIGFLRWRVFRTTDGGQTWNVVRSAPHAYNSYGPRWIFQKPVAINGSTVYVLENLFSIMTSGTSHIMKSVDGGATWTSDYFMHGYLHFLQFPDDRTGFAKGEFIGAHSNGSDRGIFLKFQALP